MTKFLLSLLFCLCIVSSHSQSKEQLVDQWIDLDEDENYIARHECSFVQAGEKFIMFGGRESAQRLDVYDYKSNTWATGGTAPKEFNHFQATFYEGFVWVIGSYKNNAFPCEIPEENIWLYYPPTETWIKGPEIPEERRRGGAGLVLYKNKFYLVAGSTNGHDGGYVDYFDVYDPRANTWTILENAPRARDHFHAAVIGQTLYAAGGRLSGGEGGVFGPTIDIVDTYNFETQTWSSLEAKLPTPRAAAGTIVFNSELYLMGGEGEKAGPARNEVEAYNPATKTWSKKANMLHPRHGTQCILSGKGIYVAGGSTIRGGGNQLNMEVYNENAPLGEELLASKLSTHKETFVPVGERKNITLINTGGNTGSFISSIEVTGVNKEKFVVHTNLNLSLVEANENILLEIEHIGTEEEDSAELHIVYNGNEEISCQLKSKNKIEIPVGDIIQDYVDKYPPNSWFLLKTGIHSGQTIEPKNGNTFEGEAGAILDGGRTPLRYAIHSEANDVTIKNLEIRSYGLAIPHKKHVTYHGVITAAHHDGISENKYARWTVEDCYVHHNRKAGVLLGDGARVLNCKITHNGQIGLKVYWANSGLVQGNEIAFNNNVDEDNETPGTYERYWEAGGTKFAWTKNLIIRNNYVHDNDGPGLWTDIDNVNALYEKNIVEDNSGIGIFHEISYSAIIRNNEVRGNGYINRGWLWEAGICIAASTGVEVYGNLMEDNFNGIVGIQQDRGIRKTDGSERLLDSVFVHDNIVKMRGNERTGFVTDLENCNLFERDITFKNNTYPGISESDKVFSWNGNIYMSYAEWLKFHPEDL